MNHEYTILAATQQLEEHDSRAAPLSTRPLRVLALTAAAAAAVGAAAVGAAADAGVGAASVNAVAVAVAVRVFVVAAAATVVGATADPVITFGQTECSACSVPIDDVDLRRIVFQLFARHDQLICILQTVLSPRQT